MGDGGLLQYPHQHWLSQIAAVKHPKPVNAIVT